MFERFTGDARAAVITAQEVARALDDRRIRTAHLLAALKNGQVSDLLAEHDIDLDGLVSWLAEHRRRPELDPTALFTLGIDLGAIRDSVESTFGAGALDTDPQPRRRWPFGKRGASSPGHLPFTDNAKKALELSLREALRFGLKSIGTETLLLGILRSDDSEVRRFLDHSAVDVAALRRATEDRLRRAA